MIKEANGIPTLMQVRRKYNETHTQHLTSQDIARAAGVSLSLEFLMEIGGKVDRESANKVLTALSEKTGIQYTLENVQVNLIETFG